jgi:hypothetical protein
MNEEFSVFASKSVKYLNDASIVSRMAHWNVRGAEYYEAHLLFERVYKDLKKLMDPHIEQLRACGFNPDFELFSGPGMSMEFYDSKSLVELTLDYIMAANSAIGMFFRFCTEHDHDPRLVGLADHLGGVSSALLVNQYLLQAWLGH